MIKLACTAALLVVAVFACLAAYGISRGHAQSQEWQAFWPLMAGLEAAILGFSSFLSWLEKR